MVKTAYYDTAFLLRALCNEHGFEKVREHADQMKCLYSSMHGRAECVSAFHRKWRENFITKEQENNILQQLDNDTKRGFFKWLPLTEKHVARVESAFRKAPQNLFLRASDALHLAIAAEHGFKEIFSNDRHLLGAASLFGLKGNNLLD